MNRRSLSLLGFLCASLGLPTEAQIATLTSDLNPSLVASGGEVRQLFQLGGRLIFAAPERTLGFCFWSSDGTANGTRLLTERRADACPIDFLSNAPTENTPIVVGEHLFYWASPGPTGRKRLWRSDGTADGTLPVTPSGLLSVRPGTTISGDRMVFRAASEAQGFEPWVTDGTPEGTFLLRDIDPGSGSSGLGAIHSLGTSAVFFADDDSNQLQLWQTDGTPEGTSFVTDFGEPAHSTPVRGAVAGNKLFFSFAVASLTGLWTSDGTPEGTRRLSLAPDGQTFVSYDSLLPLRDHVVFGAFDEQGGVELWRSDGTSGGTFRISNLDHLSPFPSRLYYSAIVELPGRHVFMAAVDYSGGRALWSTDGNPSHTRKLADLCGQECRADPAAFRLAMLGARAFFVGRDGAHGKELWSTDGTAAGTRLFFDACPGPCGDVRALEAVAGRLYFVAFDATHGYEVWESDGTAAGTRRLTSIATASLDQQGVFLLGPESLFRGELYFSATDPLHGRQLWKRGQDGSLLALTRFWSSGGGSKPGGVLDAGGRAVFHACAVDRERALWSIQAHQASPLRLTGDGLFGECGSFPVRGYLGRAGSFGYFIPEQVQPPNSLWRTDGTVAGTVELMPLSTSFLDLPFAELSGQAYFAQPGSDQMELWRSDGTASGTEPVVAFQAGMISGFTAAGDELYFFDTDFLDSSWQRRLWRSDGTQAGTLQLATLESDDSFVPQFTRAGSLVFFQMDSPATGTELWATDGTPGGTSLVKDILPGFRNARPRLLTALGDRLLFFADGEDPEFGLWRSDGSAAGTGLVRGFVEHVISFEPVRAVELDGRLLFAADDGELGLELWESDGTPGGTRLVKDILPGPGSSLAGELVHVGDRVFFHASDGIHGDELWATDGTAEGTRMVHDLAPGPVSSQPRELAVAGGRLYFAADDGLSGTELWSLDPTADPDTCPSSEGGLCLQDDRFRVEIAWRTPQGLSGFGQPVPLTADTGYFWFFNPANVESIVKVLDGRGVNGHFWTFYGALSNVEYTMTVTDAQTGLTQRYFNPQGQLASVGDTESFGPLGASLESYTPPAEDLAASLEPRIESLFDRSLAGACAPASNRLCLNGGRFAVEATWRDFAGNAGAGTAVPLTADTGYFWFFRDTNVEVVLKVLDGRPVNDKFWVFYGALSNVEYTLTVTDTATGAVKTYFNPARQFASVADTAAF